MLRISVFAFSRYTARITDANDLEVPETGSVRDFAGGGRATGTFFHMIAAL